MMAMTMQALEAAARLGAHFWCGHYRCGSGISYQRGGRYKAPYFSCFWHREVEPQYVLTVEPDWSRDDGGLPNFKWGDV